MIISKRERDWLESLKRQTQRDVESGRLDAIEAYRLAMGRGDHVPAFLGPFPFPFPPLTPWLDRRVLK